MPRSSWVEVVGSSQRCGEPVPDSLKGLTTAAALRSRHTENCCARNAAMVPRSISTCAA